VTELRQFLIALMSGLTTNEAITNGEKADFLLNQLAQHGYVIERKRCPHCGETLP